MSKLESNIQIRSNLLRATVRQVNLLYTFIFEEVDGRNKRKILREFSGFNFERGSEDYRKKMKWVKDKFVFGDLCAICLVLGLNYNEDREKVSENIINSLIDIEELVQGVEVEEDSEDEWCEDTVEAEEVKETFRNRCSMSCRDVEEFVRPFSGQDSYPVEAWFKDFEEIAAVLSWSNAEKFIFAKKSLKGVAKLFMQSEKSVTSFAKLKYLLMNEFAERINSAELHRLLCERRMAKNETVQEYYFVMKELSSRGNIEPAALIEYIVDGIEDTAINKIYLYAAENLEELKKRLITYEKVRNRSLYYKPRQQGSTQRCFNCGEIAGHFAKNCPKPRRPRGSCYHCGDESHVITSCPIRSRRKATEVTLVDCKQTPRNKFPTQVKELGTELNATIDTESTENICNTDVSDNYQDRNLNVDNSLSLNQPEVVSRPSSSEYSGPIVLVQKKTGGYCMCEDYRELNKIVKDRLKKKKKIVQDEKLIKLLTE